MRAGSKSRDCISWVRPFSLTRAKPQSITTTDAAGFIDLLHAIGSSADSTTTDTTTSLGLDRWLASPDDPFVVAAGLRCRLPLRTSRALLMAVQTWGQQHEAFMVAALAGLAHVISSYPAAAAGERFVLGSAGQGDGVLTVVEALVAPKATRRVRMAAAVALLTFLDPLTRKQHEQQEQPREQAGQAIQQDQASFTTVNMPTLPGRASRFKQQRPRDQQEQEQAQAQEDSKQLAALMVQAPTPVHRALVRLLKELATTGVAGLQQQEQEEEKEEAKHEHEEDAGYPASSLGLVQRAIDLLSALLELDPPLTPPPCGSGIRAADGGRIIDEEEADSSGRPDSYSPSYLSDDEERFWNLADVLAKEGLSEWLLRLMERFPTNAVLHRLAARVLVWLQLQCVECCPTCQWGRPRSPHEEGFVHTCGVLADAVAAFDSDPATLMPVLAALAGVVRADPATAVAVLAGKDTLARVVALLARCPADDAHRPLELNAVAVFTSMARHSEGAIVVVGAGGVEALVQLLYARLNDWEMQGQGWAALVALISQEDGAPDWARAGASRRLLAAGTLPLLEEMERKSSFWGIFLAKQMRGSSRTPQLGKQRAALDKLNKALAFCRTRLEAIAEVAARKGRRWEHYGEEAEWVRALFEMEVVVDAVADDDDSDNDGSSSRRRGPRWGRWYGDEAEEDGGPYDDVEVELVDNPYRGFGFAPSRPGPGREAAAADVTLNAESSPFLFLALTGRQD